MNIRRFGVAIALSLFSLALHAQVTATAPLSGTVTDPSGSLVPGAVVTVTHNETGTTYQAVTGSNGSFNVPSLPTGTYSVTTLAKGFKQAAISKVQMDAGVPANVQIHMEVGSQTETVTVEAAATVLQTQTATVNTTITGRQIVELPLVSREALDLTLALPGVTTPGRPRTSTVNGLSKGAINITMDGVNVQDNNGKSTDGFYTYVRPRLDAIEEVTVSTGASGADSSGEGAVQIKFVTRSGGNEYHGSLYEYHRNPALNANYWFNNRDLAPNPGTGKAPNTRVLLNQYGGRVGGPVMLPKFNGRNRAFFFVNYEEFQLPEESLRTRTIFEDPARNGLFRYAGGSVNLYTLATANGQTSTPDPTISALLAQIAGTTSKGSVSQSSDPNLDRFTFINKGGQVRKFGTARFDVNLNSRNSLELSWNYQHLFYTGEQVDFLNNSDPAFPGFPNKGSIPSRRFSGVIAWRSTITTHVVNELRGGLQGGTITFFPEVNAGQFGNQQGFNLGINAAGITSATVQSGPNRSNTPAKNVSDNLSVAHNAHSLTFGFSFTQINRWAVNQTPVPAITMGVDTTDPASAMFTAANFPGASSTDLSNARNIYAVLTGRVTAITANANLAENGKYVYAGPSTQRYQQRETGFYAQDSWRVKPNLTVNYGLRWEVQFPYLALNNRFTQASYDALFGVSGPGNLFKPGVLTGQATVYNPLPLNQHAYNTQWNNLAPNIGIAWNPRVEATSPLRFLFGSGGKSVLRAGYSIAYDREGNAAFGALANNPGGFVSAARSLTIGNLVTGTGGDTLPLLLRQPGRLGAPAFQDAPTFPMASSVSNSVNVIDPHLKMAYVQTWSAGVQREVSRNTVVELRYFGNHLARQWSTINLNEINVVENGFLNEFKLAQQNLLANMAAGRGSTFKYAGVNTGTSPLPIMLAFFSGLPASQAGDTTKYTSANFTNSTYVNALAVNQPATGTFISNLSTNSAAQRTSAINAGLPVNLFQVNPGVSAANLLTNLGGSTYNAGTIDLRRRLTRGLQFDVNYTFARGMTSVFTSLRAPLSKAMSPITITHGLKGNWIYELPFGNGKPILGNAHGALDKILGGWSLNGTGRVQSGSPFSMGNVRLVGMTRNQLQDAVRMRFDDGKKIAYFLPQDIIDNTVKAFNTSATSPTGYGANGPPTGRYIAPASAGNCIEVYAGQCGGTSLILFGPHLTKFDMSLVKKTRIGERVNIELRGELLNAFNNINFLVGNPNNDTNSATNFSSTSFGQVTQAYNDQSTTYDPGGRLVQFVLRINF